MNGPLALYVSHFVEVMILRHAIICRFHACCVRGSIYSIFKAVAASVKEIRGILITEIFIDKLIDRLRERERGKEREREKERERD